MMEKPDYSLLDTLGLAPYVFHPRSEWAPLPSGASDHMVPVTDAVSISCRFYPLSKNSPCVLFFHGNGEIACDYDWIAPFYNRAGASMFVADYRGYGKSNGEPTFANTIDDAWRIHEYLLNFLELSGFASPIFVMGRSLGSFSAIHIVSSGPETVRGLILESGSVRPARLLRYIGFSPDSPVLDGFREDCLEVVGRIRVPALIIHGEEDDVIPCEDALVSYESIGSCNKRLLTIAGAGHNNILMVGMEAYFEAIEDLISGRQAE